MATSTTAKPRNPPLRRQKSEAEILSYGTGESDHVTMGTATTIISHHIQHLTFVDNKYERHHDLHDHSLGEKFHDSVNVKANINNSVVDNLKEAAGSKSSSVGSENQAPTSTSTSPNKPPLARRASLSTLEESHLTKIGCPRFDSEAEKARKARRKSFEKVTRKRSGGGGSEDRERNSGRSRKDKGEKVIPTIPDG